MRRCPYTPEKAFYQKYYASGGSLPYFQGELFQRGSGLGSRILSTVLNIAAPLIKPRATKLLGNITKKVGLDKAVHGKIARKAIEVGLDTVEDLVLKRKKAKETTQQRAPKRKTQPPKTRKPKKKRVKDIFD